MALTAIDIIKRKRDGGLLTKEEIIYIVNHYCSKDIPDYQFSAFLMAAFLNGLSKDETAYLTEAMLHSGEIVKHERITGLKIDKHSTGGVGDKTSLIIAPIAAAAGVYVPMISGRGLGHTGGTLDKLESIPGFTTNVTLQQFKDILYKTGAVMIGQTAEIAPADKKIYALRDVTGTVESIPFITASIMSKKLAEGIDGLVLDVKTGCGAFMKTPKDSRLLAHSLISTAKASGKKVIAFITSMNQPLGSYIGNWLEVVESVKVLRGEIVDGDLYDLCVQLAGAMIYLGGKAGSLKEGMWQAEELLKNGKAWDKFLEIVTAHNGDVKYLLNLDLYPKPVYQDQVNAEADGFLSYVDTYGIGMAAIELGAGRKTKEDVLDLKAGMIIKTKIGDKLKKGDVLLEIFADSPEKINFAKERLKNVFELSAKEIERPQLIKRIIE